MSPTSIPESDCGFAERLDWLLAMVPTVPGSSARYSEDDLVAAWARLTPLSRNDVDEARALLESARAGSLPLRRLPSRFMVALEELFRLPLGYFRDPGVATRVDARIQFANDATASGLRVLGPCRVMDAEMTADQLHALHREVAEALDRRQTR